MLELKNLNNKDPRVHDLRAENARLRVALRQAQEFCITKEKKSIEYIFHLGQFRSSLANRLDAWLSKFFRREPLASAEAPAAAHPSEERAYVAWLERFDVLSEDDYAKIHDHLTLLAGKIKFSLIIDCRGRDVVSLASTLLSLNSQLYQNCQIIICSENSSIAEELREYFDAANKPIKNCDIIYISSSPDLPLKSLLIAAAQKIGGDYVGFLTSGDKLHERALYEFAAEIDIYPQTKALYADEDALGGAGQRLAPCFKPDWNLELFLGQNYTGQFCLIAREAVFSSADNLSEAEGLEVLQFRVLTNLARDAIRHVPNILYHRAPSPAAMEWTRRSSKLTAEYLSLKGVKAEAVELASNADWVEVRRACPDPAPLVTIIIPTRNRPDLLSVCLCGVLSETDYENVEVIIVDHENDHPGVYEIFKTYLNDPRVTVMPYSGVFDHSDMNNRAADIARGDILLFLNDDIEVINPHWLAHIVGQLAQDDRGVVGAKLLYPSRYIQHAGVILGFGGVAGHGHVGLGSEDAGYYGRLQLASEVSALTGACMAMRRELFEEVGGFSARHLQRTFNDVDLCLKAWARGKINIFTPLATLIHHESATDGGDLKLKNYKRLQNEVGYMLETWGLMRADPHYNVNLALEGTSFTLAAPPRRVAPWEIAAAEGSDRG